MTMSMQEWIEEAHAWLRAQGLPPLQSSRWYAYNDFRAFVRAVQRDPTQEGILCAIHILQRQMSHRWDWSADYSDKIISFYQRAGRIARGVQSYAGA